MRSLGKTAFVNHAHWFTNVVLPNDRICKSFFTLKILNAPQQFLFTAFRFRFHYCSAGSSSRLHSFPLAFFWFTFGKTISFSFSISLHRFVFAFVFVFVFVHVLVHCYIDIARTHSCFFSPVSFIERYLLPPPLSVAAAATNEGFSHKVGVVFLNFFDFF